MSRNLSLDFLGLAEEENAEGEEGEPLGYTPQLDTANQRSWLDIYVESASGGGGAGGGHP